jgi:hypothetical protein
MSHLANVSESWKIMIKIKQISIVKSISQLLTMKDYLRGKASESMLSVHMSFNQKHIIITVIIMHYYYLLAALGFTLRASGLLDRHSTT